MWVREWSSKFENRKEMSTQFNASNFASHTHTHVCACTHVRVRVCVCVCVCLCVCVCVWLSCHEVSHTITGVYVYASVRVYAWMRVCNYGRTCACVYKPASFQYIHIWTSWPRVAKGQSPTDVKSTRDRYARAHYTNPVPHVLKKMT